MDYITSIQALFIQIGISTSNILCSLSSKICSAS